MDAPQSLPLRKQTEKLLNDTLAPHDTPSASTRLEHWHGLSQESMAKTFDELDNALMRVASQEVASLAPVVSRYICLLKHVITGASANVSGENNEEEEEEEEEEEGDVDVDMDGMDVIREETLSQSVGTDAGSPMPVPPNVIKLKVIRHFLQSKAAHVVLSVHVMNSTKHGVVPEWMIQPLADTFTRDYQQLREQLSAVGGSALLSLIQTLQQTVFSVAGPLVQVINRVVQTLVSQAKDVSEWLPSLQRINTTLLQMILSILVSNGQFTKSAHPEHVTNSWSLLVDDVTQCNANWMATLTKIRISNETEKFAENIILICDAILDHCSKSDLWRPEFCNPCFAAVTNILCHNVNVITKHVRDRELHAAASGSNLPHGRATLHSAIKIMASAMLSQAQTLRSQMHARQSQLQLKTSNQLNSFISMIKEGIMTLLPTYAHILVENRRMLLNVLSLATSCNAKLVIALSTSQFPEKHRITYQGNLDHLITVPVRGIFTRIMEQSVSTFVALLRDMNLHHRQSQEEPSNTGGVTTETGPKLESDTINSISQEDSVFGGTLIITTLLSILVKDDMMTKFLKTPALERFIFSDFIEIIFQHIEQCNPLYLTCASKVRMTDEPQQQTRKLKGNTFMQLWRVFCLPLATQISSIVREWDDTLVVPHFWNEIESVFWRKAALSTSALSRQLATDMLCVVFLYFSDAQSDETEAIHPFAKHMVDLLAEMAGTSAENLFGISPDEPSDEYKQQQYQCFYNIRGLVDTMISVMPLPLIHHFMQRLSLSQLICGKGSTSPSATTLSAMQLSHLPILSVTVIKTVVTKTSTSISKLVNLLDVCMEATISIGASISRHHDTLRDGNGNSKMGSNVSISETSLLCAGLSNIHSLINYAAEEAILSRLLSGVGLSRVDTFIDTLLALLRQYKDDIQQQAEYRGPLASKPTMADKDRWWRGSSLVETLLIFATLIRQQQQSATIASADIVQILQNCNVLFAHSFWTRPMISFVAAALGSFNLSSVSDGMQQQQLIQELSDLFKTILSSSIGAISFTVLDKQHHGTSQNDDMLNRTGVTGMRDEGMKWMMAQMAIDSFIQFQKTTQRKDLVAKIISSLNERIRRVVHTLMKSGGDGGVSLEGMVDVQVMSESMSQNEEDRNEEDLLPRLETEVKRLKAMESLVPSATPTMSDSDAQRANFLQRARRAMTLAMDQLRRADQLAKPTSDAVVNQEVSKAKASFGDLEMAMYNL